MTIEIHPTGGALGAEVRGASLGDGLDDAGFAAIRQAWLDHLLLLFRDPDLAPADMAAFSQRFGELDMVASWRDFHAAGDDRVLVISNVKEGGAPAGVLGDGELDWHTDMSYLDVPPSASILHAREVPATGGDTHFMNMYAVLDALPADLSSSIEGRRLNHDSSYDSSGGLRPGAPAVVDVRVAPGAQHPMIRHHPESGRRALYLGRRRNAYILGMGLEESEALLDRLWAIACEPRFAFTHTWRQGDLLMWDNRATMHRRDAFDPAARRVMHRTQVKGERPLSA